MLDHLKKFRLRAKVQLQDLSSGFRVWTQFGLGKPVKGGDLRGPADPRLPEALGKRTILPAGAPVPPVVDMAPVDDYRLWRRVPTGATAYVPVNRPEHPLELPRYVHGVAEGSSEIPPRSSMPLEYSLDTLQGISYSKAGIGAGSMESS